MSCDHNHSSLEFWLMPMHSPLQRGTMCAEQLRSEAVVVCYTECDKQPKLLESSRTFHRSSLSFHSFGLPGR